MPRKKSGGRRRSKSKSAYKSARRPSKKKSTGPSKAQVKKFIQFKYGKTSSTEVSSEE